MIIENDEETEQETNGLAEVETEAQRLAEAEEAKKLAEAAEKERQNELAIEVERQRKLEEEAAEAKQLNEIKGAERLAETQSIAKIAKDPKGASTYYVTSILAIFDPPLPPVIMCHHF